MARGTGPERPLGRTSGRAEDEAGLPGDGPGALASGAAGPGSEPDLGRGPGTATDPAPARGGIGAAGPRFDDLRPEPSPLDPLPAVDLSAPGPTGPEAEEAARAVAGEPALGADLDRSGPAPWGAASAGSSSLSNPAAPAGMEAGVGDGPRGDGEPGAARFEDLAPRAGPAEDDHAAGSPGRDPSDLGAPELGPRAPAPEDGPTLILPGRAEETGPRDRPGPSGPAPRPPHAAEAPPRRPAPSRRRGAVGALLLGGMIAAALGFGAAWLARDRLALDPGPEVEARLVALEAAPAEAPAAPAFADPGPRLDRIEERLAALEEAASEPAAAPGPIPDLAPLREEAAAATAAAEDAQRRADALDARLLALEAGPVVGTPPDAAPEASPEASSEAPLGSLAAADAAPLPDPDALRDEVLAAVEPRLAGIEDVAPRLATLEDAQAALAARLDAAEAAAATARTAAGAAESEAAAAREAAARAAEELASAQGEAEAAAARAQGEAALAALAAALDAGEPLGPALASLDAAGVAPPAALSAVAEGAPTLAALREAYPEAARAALAGAREAGLTDEGGGVSGFLSRQLSLRSTAPRLGEDPDAVLSRAEGALDQGRLAGALREIGALPEPARAAMTGWIAAAEARAAADAAVAEVRGALEVEPDPGPAVDPAAAPGPSPEPAVEPAN